MQPDGYSFATLSYVPVLGASAGFLAARLLTGYRLEMIQMTKTSSAA